MVQKAWMALGRLMAWIFLGKASFSREAKHRKITWVVKILVDYQKGLEF